MPPLLQMIAERGPVRQQALTLALGWNAEITQKTLENARNFGYAQHNGQRLREDKIWELTAAGWEKIGRKPSAAPAPAPAAAADGVPHVCSADEARAWAYHATGAKPPPQAEPVFPAQPSIDLAEVQHLPVREVDIDAIHHKRQAVAAPPAVAPDESDFLCSLYSDGRLIIETHGVRCVLPKAHARQLVDFLVVARHFFLEEVPK